MHYNMSQKRQPYRVDSPTVRDKKSHREHQPNPTTYNVRKSGVSGVVRALRPVELARGFCKESLICDCDCAEVPEVEGVLLDAIEPSTFRTPQNDDTRAKSAEPGEPIKQCVRYHVRTCPR